MTDATVGTVLTSADPEPPVGTIVLCLGNQWGNLGDYWVALDRDGGPETWNKIAGNYGPATILRIARRRCTSEACDEYDDIHSHGDGCAMATADDQLERYEAVAQGLRANLRAMIDADMPEPSPLKTAITCMADQLADTVERPSPLTEMIRRRPDLRPSGNGACYEASWGWVHSRPSCRCPR